MQELGLTPVGYVWSEQDLRNMAMDFTVKLLCGKMGQIEDVFNVIYGLLKPNKSSQPDIPPTT